MDFDFIRYKARALQTTSFNALLFSVDIDIQSQIQVKVFKAGSKPFVVVWASSLQVDAIARALTSKHIAVEVALESAIDIIAVALTALHVEMTADGANNLDLTVVVSPDGAVAIFAPGEYELTATADIALDSSKSIISDAESAGVITVVVQLLGFATLSEYDADTLSTLDTMSLQAIAYIEI